MTLPSVQRIDFGYFVRPAQETGTDLPRVEALLGYAVIYDAGVLLFDTGLAEGDAGADAWYKPVRQPLAQALHDTGITVADVRWVANCHLHFDHCGGNPAFPDIPIFVQSVELQTARTITDYTLPQAIDFPGASYQEVEGETEIFANTLLIPTPGHTRGHQALAILYPDGSIVLAGQGHNSAFDYGAEHLAWRARQEKQVHDDSLSYRPWIERLEQLDPRRILFAHDYAVWEPGNTRHGDT